MPEPGEEGSPQRPTDAYAAEYTVFLLGEEETLSGHLDPEFRCYGEQRLYMACPVQGLSAALPY